MSKHLLFNTKKLRLFNQSSIYKITCTLKISSSMTDLQRSQVDLRIGVIGSKTISGATSDLVIQNGPFTLLNAYDHAFYHCFYGTLADGVFTSNDEYVTLTGYTSNIYAQLNQDGKIIGNDKDVSGGKSTQLSLPGNVYIDSASNSLSTKYITPVIYIDNKSGSQISIIFDSIILEEVTTSMSANGLVTGVIEASKIGVGNDRILLDALNNAITVNGTETDNSPYEIIRIGELSSPLDGYGIEIKNKDGLTVLKVNDSGDAQLNNITLGEGSVISWTSISDTDGRPESNATYNAYQGQWSVNHGQYIKGDIVFSAISGSSFTCKETHQSSIYSLPQLPDTDNAQWGILAKKGDVADKGSNVITAILSNETHVIGSDQYGANPDFSRSGTEIRAYDGRKPLNFDPAYNGTVNGTYKVDTHNINCTRGLYAVTMVPDQAANLGSDGLFSIGVTGTAFDNIPMNIAKFSNITGISGDFASINYTISGKTFTGEDFAILKTQKFSKIKAGAAGMNGDGSWISITADSRGFFVVDNEYLPEQGTVTFTIQSQGLSGSAVSWGLKYYTSDDLSIPIYESGFQTSNLLTYLSPTEAQIFQEKWEAKNVLDGNGNIISGIVQATVIVTVGDLSASTTIFRLDRSTAQANADRTKDALDTVVTTGGGIILDPNGYIRSGGKGLDGAGTGLLYGVAASGGTIFNVGTGSPHTDAENGNNGNQYIHWQEDDYGDGVGQLTVRGRLNADDIIAGSLGVKNILSVGGSGIECGPDTDQNNRGYFRVYSDPLSGAMFHVGQGPNVPNSRFIEWANGNLHINADIDMRETNSVVPWINIPEDSPGRPQNNATRNLFQGPWMVNYTSTFGEDYIIGDSVHYELTGSTYTCIQGHVGDGSILPTNTGYWSLLASKGDQGNTGSFISYIYSMAVSATTPTFTTNAAAIAGPVWRDAPTTPDIGEHVWMSKATVNYLGEVVGPWSIPIQQSAFNGDSVDIIYKRGTGSSIPPANYAAAGWVTLASAIPSGADAIWASVGKSTDGGVSFAWQPSIKIEGEQLVELTIYSRGTPSGAPVNGTYNFATKSFTSLPSMVGSGTWSTSIPVGTSPVYTSRTTIFASSGFTGTKVCSGWTTPVVSLKDGNYQVAQFAIGTKTAVTGSWFNADSPPTPLDGEYLWQRMGTVIPPAVTPASWGTATRISGEKGDQGEPGLFASSFGIQNAGAIFVKSETGISPSSITITTNKENISTPISYEWRRSVAGSGSEIIQDQTGSSLIVNSTEFDENVSITYSCTINGKGNGGATVIISDYITIPRLDHAGNSPTVLLSNENMGVTGPATLFENLQFGSQPCVVTAYIGDRQLLYGISGADTFSVVFTHDGVSGGTESYSGNTYTVPLPDAMSKEGATTHLEITIRDANGNPLENTIEKVISYPLSRSSVNSFNSFVFALSSAALTGAPTGGSYSSPRPTSTSPVTWYDGPPNNPSNLPLWMSVGTFYSNIVGTTWSIPENIANSTSTRTRWSASGNNPTTDTDWSETISNAWMRIDHSSDGGITWNRGTPVKVTGEGGNSSSSFFIMTASAIFTDNLSSILPITITLDTHKENIDSPTYRWFKDTGAGDVLIPSKTLSSLAVSASEFTSATSIKYSCEISGNGGLTVIKDTVTIPKLVYGSNSPVVLMSNENIGVTGPNSGFTGATFGELPCKVTAYIGSKKLSYSSSGGANTFSVNLTSIGVSGGGAPIIGADSSYTVPLPSIIWSNTAATNVDVTIRDHTNAELAPISRVITYPISRAGSIGIAATYVELSVTRQAIAYNADDTIVDSTKLTFTATPYNISGNKYYSFSDSLGGSQAKALGKTYEINPQSSFFSTPITVTVEMYDTQTSTTKLSSDVITLIAVKPGADGEDALSGYLTNESTTIPAGTTGVATGYGTTNGTFRILLGTTDVNGTGVTSFLVDSTTNGIVAQINQTSGDYSITSIPATASGGIVTFHGKHTPTNTVIIKVLTVYKQNAAISGSNVSYVELTAESQAIQYTQLGSVSASGDIKLTAVPYNLSTGVIPYYEFFNGGSSIKGKSTDDWVNFTKPATYFSAPVTITVKMYNGNTTTLISTDNVTLIAIKPGLDGVDALAGYLTNESTIIPSKFDGTSPDLSTANGKFCVFKGIEEITGSGKGIEYTSIASVGISGGIDTLGDYSITGINKDTYTGTLNLSAKYKVNNVQVAEIKKKFTVSKQKAVSSAIVIDLTNDNASVPTDGFGNGGNYGNAVTTCNVTYAGENDNDNWLFAPNIPTGITGEITNSGRTVRITNMVNDVGLITFTVSGKSGTDRAAMTKYATFTLNKNKSGVSYSIVPSVNSISKTGTIYTPNKITFNATSVLHDGTTSPYHGIIFIYESSDGITFSKVYSSSTLGQTLGESSYQHTPSAGKTHIKAVLCKSNMIVAGGFTIGTRYVINQSGTVFSSMVGVTNQNGEIFSAPSSGVGWGNAFEWVDEEDVPILLNGANGLTASYVEIGASRQAITYNADNTFSSAAASGNLTFTATPYNVSNIAPHYEFYITKNGGQETKISPATRTATTSISCSAASYIELPMVVKVILYDGSTSTIPLSTDAMTIIGVKPGLNGEDALSGYLTNESTIIPANSAGAATSYSTATGVFNVFYGVNNVTSSCTFTSAKSSGITIGSITVSGSGAGAYSITEVTDATTSGTLTLTAQYKPPGKSTVSLVKLFTFYKQNAATNAVDAIVIDLTNDNVTVPTDNNGNGGNFSNATTTCNITYGGSLDNDKWNFSATTFGGVHCSTPVSGNTQTVDSMTSDVGYVRFVATGKSGTARAGIEKIAIFTLNKNKGGIAYQVIPSVSTIVKTIPASQVATFSPTSIEFTASSLMNTGVTASYLGNIFIYSSTDGTTFSYRSYYASSTAASTLRTFSGFDNNTHIKVILGHASIVAAGSFVIGAKYVIINGGGSQVGSAFGGAGNGATWIATTTGYNQIGTACLWLDEETIPIVANGTNGTNATDVAVIDLTNDNVTVPTDYFGNYGNYGNAFTTCNITYAAVNDNANWNFSVSKSTGVVCSTPVSANSQIVTGMTQDTGTLTFTATGKGIRAGLPNKTIVFTLSKSKSGISYEVLPSVDTIIKTVPVTGAATFNPTSISFELSSLTALGTRAAYSGNLFIYSSTNGIDFVHEQHYLPADARARTHSTFTGKSHIKAILGSPEIDAPSFVIGGKYIVTTPGTYFTSNGITSSGGVIFTATVSGIGFSGKAAMLLDEEIIPILQNGANGAPGSNGILELGNAGIVVSTSMSDGRGLNLGTNGYIRTNGKALNGAGNGLIYGMSQSGNTIFNIGNGSNSQLKYGAANVKGMLWDGTDGSFTVRGTIYAQDIIGLSGINLLPTSNFMNGAGTFGGIVTKAPTLSTGAPDIIVGQGYHWNACDDYTISVNEGDIFDISVWVWTPQVGEPLIKAGLRQFDENDWYQGHLYINSSTSEVNKWVKLSGSVTIPSGIVNVQFAVHQPDWSIMDFPKMFEFGAPSVVKRSTISADIIKGGTVSGNIIAGGTIIGSTFKSPDDAMIINTTSKVLTIHNSDNSENVSISTNGLSFKVGDKTYKGVRRIDTGKVGNQGAIVFSTPFKTLPFVFLSMKNMPTYNHIYAGLDQKLICEAVNLSTVGFTAMIGISSNSGTGVEQARVQTVNSYPATVALDTWYEYPADGTDISAMSITFSAYTTVYHTSYANPTNYPYIVTIERSDSSWDYSGGLHWFVSIYSSTANFVEQEVKTTEILPTGRQHRLRIKFSRTYNSTAAVLAVYEARGVHTVKSFTQGNIIYTSGDANWIAIEGGGL